MFDRRNQFIAGRWLESAGDSVLDVISPTTERQVGRVPVATSAEVDLAVEAAREALELGPWPKLELSERERYLRRLVWILRSHRARVVDLQILEGGATRAFARETLGAVGQLLERAIGDSARMCDGEPGDGAGGQVVVSRRPIGVTAAITSGDAPVAGVLSQLLPSLLIGCPTVVKPSAESPLSCYVLAQAVIEAGLPPGVVSIVNGGAEVGAYLVSHPGVDAVAFTGRPTTGKAVAEACAALRRPVTLELGGASVALVAEGTDMRPHLRSLVDSSLGNSGPTRVSTNRVLVHESQRDAVVGQLTDFVADLKLGDPDDEDTYFGPLRSEWQREIVESYVTSGLHEGAKLVYGGGRPKDLTTGWFVEPTIFVDVKNNMRIAQEDVFGPVLSVVSYRDEEEAIRMANDRRSDLGGAVFASDPADILRLANRIHVGDAGLDRKHRPGDLELFLGARSPAMPAGFGPSEFALSTT